MSKNISIIVLILLGSLVFANGEPFDVTERKEVGFLENRCEERSELMVCKKILLSDNDDYSFIWCQE